MKKKNVDSHKFNFYRRQGKWRSDSFSLFSITIIIILKIPPQDYMESVTKN